MIVAGCGNAGRHTRKSSMLPHDPPDHLSLHDHRASWPQRMLDVVLIARCAVPDCAEHSKPHEQIVSRATLYQMFDPDGSDRIFFGIEVYDGQTFERKPPVPSSVAPGVYHLSFSPDGQRVFVTTNWPQPSLDIFDFASRDLVRSRMQLQSARFTTKKWSAQATEFFCSRLSAAKATEDYPAEGQFPVASSQ